MAIMALFKVTCYSVIASFELHDGPKPLLNYVVPLANVKWQCCRWLPRSGQIAALQSRVKWSLTQSIGCKYISIKYHNNLKVKSVGFQN